MAGSIKGGYARIEISLEKEETDKLLHLQGDYVSIVTITGVGSCKLRWNHRHSPEIDMREVTGITGAFDKLYLTTDGGGGTCTMYVGLGVALQISPDINKLWAGGIASTQLETSTTDVKALSNGPYRLTQVHIYNSNGFYACYFGPYNSNAAFFKTKAYVLMPHKHIKFTNLELSAVGVISYDATHTVIVDIIGLMD